MPKINRLPEEAKKREEKREELKKILPFDLQLKFVKGKPNKDQWQFEGELVKRRHSQEKDNQLFYEAINSINNKDIKQLEKIKELKEQEKHQLLNRLKVFNLYEQGMNDKYYYVKIATAESLSSLASVNPAKFVELCEKGINDKDYHVKIATAKSLSALAPVNPDKFIELCKKGIKDEDYDVRSATAESLSALAHINPDKFVELCEKGMNEKDYYIKFATAQSLSALAPVNPNKFVKLCEKGMNDKNDNVRSATAKSLSALASINPDKFVKLCEKGMNDNYGVESATAQSLSTLAHINPNKFVKLCEKGMNEKDSDVKIATAHSLSALASINPDKFIELCEKGINDKDRNVRSVTAEFLSALALINPDKFVELYEKGMNDEDYHVRSATAKSISTLYSIDPDKFVELYEKGINDNNPYYIKYDIARSISALASIDPDKFVELYEKGINDNNPDYIKYATAESLSALAPVDPDKFVELCESGMNDKSDNVKIVTAKSLSALASINPDKFVELYEKGINDKNHNVKFNTALSLSALASVNPDKFVELCEQGINNKDYDVKIATAQSLSALASINPDKFVELCERGMNDDDNYNVRLATAQSLSALASINPDKFVELCEKGMSDNNPDVRINVVKSLSFAISSIDFNLLNKVDSILINDYQLKGKELNYAHLILANPLEHDEDISKLITDYLPQYRYIQKYAENVNENIGETKKWQNPQDFFDKHNNDIAYLQQIDLNLSTQLLKNHLSRGLSLADSYLNLFQPILTDKEITNSIKQYIGLHNDLNGYNFSDLLEIAAAYHTLDDHQLFTNLIEENKDKDFNELKSLLNRNILKKLADKLNLFVEVKDQDLSAWKIKYLANLITNQELLKREGSETRKMCNAVLKAVLENRFDDFISNINQADEIGRQIAKHNQKVEQSFKEVNISWSDWLHFNETVIMNINTQKKQDREALFNQFEQRFSSWQSTVNQYEPRLKDSLNKDLTLLNQKKKEFDPSKIDLNDPLWLEQLLPTYTKSLKFIQSKDPHYELPSPIQEAFDHLTETIKLLTQEQQKEQTNSKDFYVKLWDRDPRKDLFQGNYTHCCISVGVKEAPPGANTYATYHPETIFQYLIDQGINVAEIVDPDNNDVIAQTWLFVTLDKDKKPVLVADNFEVNNRYPAGHNVNRGIRESMFTFLNHYAKTCHIPNVVLGHVSTNDIETADLKTINLPPIKKLGGYFNDDKYYLETLGSTQAFEIKKEG